MSDKNLETVSNSDSENWDVLQSIFLETPSPASPPSPSLDNWDVLQSLFGLTGGHTSEPTDGSKPNPAQPEPPIPEDPSDGEGSPAPPTPIKTILESIKRAKQIAEDASLKARTAQQTVETAQKATENLKTQAEAANRSAQQSQQAIEAVKQRSQQTQQAVEAVKTKVDVDYRAIEAAKLGTYQAQQAIEAAKTDAQAAYQATEAAKQQAEASILRIQQLQQAAETAQKQAEVARSKTEKAQSEAEALLKKMSGIGSSNAGLIQIRLFLEALKQHKTKLLLGSIALIPLLLLLPLLLPFLSRVFFPRPAAASIYVNPITGNDANEGTAFAPLRTLPHALRQARSGSHIYLAKGDYSTNRSLTIPANTTLVIQPFNDIDGHWAEPFIRAFATQGLVAGYPDGSFQPDTHLTRAEYATLLTKVFDLPEARSARRFTDVKSDFWAYSSIQSTYSSGFLQGFPERNFKPNDNTQRVQVIAALVSGLGLPTTSPTTQLNRYRDSATIPGWAKAQVATATDEQLIANYPNLQQLNPVRSATRAETVVMMYQSLVKQGKIPAIESPYLVRTSR